MAHLVDHLVEQTKLAGIELSALQIWVTNNHSEVFPSLTVQNLTDLHKWTISLWEDVYFAPSAKALHKKCSLNQDKLILGGKAYHVDTQLYMPFDITDMYTRITDEHVL